MATLLNLNVLDMHVLPSHYVTAQKGRVFIVMFALIRRSRLHYHTDCDPGALRNDKKGHIQTL